MNSYNADLAIIDPLPLNGRFRRFVTAQTTGIASFHIPQHTSKMLLVSVRQSAYPRHHIFEEFVSRTEQGEAKSPA
jgi:hypothetical protein